MVPYECILTCSPKVFLALMHVFKEFSMQGIGGWKSLFMHSIISSRVRFMLMSFYTAFYSPASGTKGYVI